MLNEVPVQSRAEGKHLAWEPTSADAALSPPKDFSLVLRMTCSVIFWDTTLANAGIDVDVQIRYLPGSDRYLFRQFPLASQECAVSKVNRVGTGGDLGVKTAVAAQRNIYDAV